MGTGYTRKDIANNIDDGNVINAADLDLEFDGIQSAFDNSTGHTHDGTAGEGAPIETIGPAQDIVSTASALRPKTDNTVDLGTTALEYKDLFLDGTAHIDTLDVDENASITGTLSVTSTSTFSDDVTFTGDNYDVVWDKSGDALEFRDNAKAVFGNGGDLQIYHNGNHSFITDVGTGDLYIRSSDVKLQDETNAEMAEFLGQGAVKLYYDKVNNSAPKLQTTSTGISVTGDVDASDDLILSSDSSKVTFGADGDVEIIHNHNAGLTIDRATTSTGSLVLALRSNQDTIVAGDQISRINFSTNSSAGGAAVGTQASIRVEATGTYSNTVAGSLMEFYTTKSNGTNSRAMYIDDDQSIHFTGGTNVVLDATNDTLDLPDNFKIMVGNGDDLQIYHNGTNSFIADAGTGGINIRTNLLNIQNAAGTETLAQFIEDSAVILRHNNTTRIQTTGNGADFTGDIFNFNGTAAGTKIQIQTTNSGASDGPVLELYRNSSSPAANDDIGRIDFMGEDSAGAAEVYGRIEAYIEDPTAAAEKGRMRFMVDSAGTLTDFMQLDASNGGARGRILLNGNAEDIDLIVRGDTENNLLYADASTDRIGIGTSTPVASLHVNSGTANTVARFESSDTESVIELVDTTGRAQIRSRNDFRFYVDGDSVRAMDITSSGNVGIGTSSPSKSLDVNKASATFRIRDASAGNDFSVKTISGPVSLAGSEANTAIGFMTNNTERMRIASDGNVGIGTNNPQYGRLHIYDDNSDIDMDTVGSGQLHIDGNGYAFGVALNADGAQLYTNSTSRNIILGVNETERFRIDNYATTTLTGTQPRIVFDNGDTTLSQGQLIGEIDFKNNDASGYGPNVAANIRAQATGTGGQNAALLFRTRTPTTEGADATTTMYMGSNGYVGINTEAPEATLHVNDIGTTGPAVFIENAGATEGDIVVADGEAMQIGHWNTTSNTFTERGRFDSSGNFLVGRQSVGGTGAGHVLRGGDSPIFSRVANSLTSEVMIVNKDSYEGVIVQLRNNGAARVHIGVANGDTDPFFGNGSAIGLRWEQTGADRVEPCFGDDGDIRDNAIDLGGASSRFDDVYATNNAIQTSDEREKQQIASLTTSEIAAAKAISKLFKTYKWNDSVEEKGDAARTHAGVIAQQVESAMTAEGLDVGDYAFFTSTTWWETVTDVAAQGAVIEDGITVHEAKPARKSVMVYDTADEAPEGATERNRKGIRYGELMSFIHAATEQRLASIESRLDALESA